MDTSETYVKMCEKAEEIQALHLILQRGDFIFNKRTEKDIFLVFPTNHDSDLIWLPRQDQLQEMIDDEYQKIAKFWRFVDFLKNPYDKRSHQNTWIVWTNMNGENAGSMEQLWLAFVMKKRWNKTWNGEEWV